MPPSRRDELVDSAMKVFYRNGFHNTGLDMIVKESGISRMTLYNHFKSKDELIIATLRRRDEIFRNQLMMFVDDAEGDPVERILSVFDYHQAWFHEDTFSGCMFINASAEYADSDCAARRVSAEHKLEITRYLAGLCKDADLHDPHELAERLNLLIEGAIVHAHVVCRVQNNEMQTCDTALRAKEIARLLISQSRSQPD